MSIKSGCVLMLVVWLGSSYIFWNKIDPAIEARIWIAVGLGLLLSFFVGQIWSLLISIKKLIVSGRSIESWRDGDLVGISGAIRPKENAITAPASGTQSVIVEYELERREIRRTSKGSNTTYVKDITGFLMAPCGIHTKRGMLRLHGFPMLNSFSQKSYSDQEHLERIADYLVNTTYEPVTSNVVSAFKELSSVYDDADGDVLKNFVNSNSRIRPDLFEEDNDTGQDGASVSEAGSVTEAKKSAIIGAMLTETYRISERIVTVGMEVTAFGTYNEKQRAINVGSGLKSTTHSLQPGELSSVARWGVIKSVLGLVFWGGALLAANYFTFPEIKELVDEQIIASKL